MHQPMRLGASLYVPATRFDIEAIVNGRRFGRLRSVILCAEDAIADGDVDLALDNLAQALPRLEPSSTACFLRVRNVDFLCRMLDMPGVERLDGFVLPKVNRRTFPAYAGLFSAYDRFSLMPTLETVEVFDVRQMIRFRRQLDASPLRPRILALRIGGNDLLNILGVRREPGATIYDTPLSTVISQLIQAFRPAGFALASPVFDQLDARDVLSREAARDAAYGLLGKAAVHPSQIPVIEASYAVRFEELAMARAVLEPSAAPVFRFQGCMCEPKTQRTWALAILERSKLFGIQADGGDLEPNQYSSAR